MKRFGILTLCLVLAAASALAGTEPVALKQLSDTLGLVYSMPEGVKSVEVTDQYDMKIVTYEMEDASLPTYTLVISHSDVLSEKDITDLSEEEIETLVAFTAHDAEAYAYEMVEMEDGWPAVLVRYEGESDWVEAFTVIWGYLIQMHGAHDDFRPLTEAEDQLAFTLLDSVDIVEETAE